MLNEKREQIEKERKVELTFVCINLQGILTFWLQEASWDRSWANNGDDEFIAFSCVCSASISTFPPECFSCVSSPGHKNWINNYKTEKQEFTKCQPDAKKVFPSSHKLVCFEFLALAHFKARAVRRESSKKRRGKSCEKINSIDSFFLFRQSRISAGKIDNVTLIDFPLVRDQKIKHKVWS